MKITNELIHTDRGEDTFRFLSRFNCSYLASVTKVKRMYQPDLVRDLGLKWSSPEELVLFEGTEISANINDCRFPAMPAGNCFANAFRLALEDPSLRYHEGWACMESSIATHHGWVVDANGEVHDPTWLTVVRQPQKAAPPHVTNRCVYMGIHIPLRQHIGWFLNEGDVNLLARGEMVPPGLLESGMGVFAPHDVGDVSPELRASMIEVLDKASRWTLDEATGIFHRDGQRWCGRRERYLEDGED